MDASPAQPTVDAWPGLELIEPLSGGSRNSVWLAARGAERFIAKRSRRSFDSLEWELQLCEHLVANGVNAPIVLPTAGGELHAGGVVVQHWIRGRQPATEADWTLVVDYLRTVHELAEVWPQRPGCCAVTELAEHRVSVDADMDMIPPPERSILLDVFSAYRDAPISTIHGDLSPNNIVIGDDDAVTLIDWDESRVDVTWHDVSSLGVQVLDDERHARAVMLSHAWEAANAWVVEPDYARRRRAFLIG